MGLFGNKIEMKREYFSTSLDLDENSIIDLRMRQGFRIKRGIDFGTSVVVAEKTTLLRSFKITHKFYIKGNEREFRFHDLILFKDFMTFLKQNFTPVPDNVRFKFPDGIFRNYYIPSVYLPDGNVLARKNVEPDQRSFTFHVISKDRIIK